MIISVLDNKSAGFFSSLFFSINHYIFCKQNNIYFKLNSDNWLYKSKKGWTDYFLQDVEFKGDDSMSHVFHHDDILGDYNMYYYRDALLNDIYIYNDEIKIKIEETKKKMNLVKGDYDSIYIRRGDKLCYESRFYSTEKYIELLLIKNPNCKTIFLQTDDYNCFLDIEKYISEKNLDIQLISMCKPTEFGVINYKIDVEKNFNPDCDVIKGDIEHIKYFNLIKERLKETKSVDQYNSEEIYNHTVNMIIGVDIIRQSKYCVLDNQSNVSRFINITHDNIENVFDIRFPEINYDMNRTRIPAWN